MKKQVEYEFRLLKVSAIDPTASREELSKIVNAYLAVGWEVFKVDTVTYAGNEAYNAYHFVRYEDVQPEDAVKAPKKA
jgi:hypothetical protein